MATTAVCATSASAATPLRRPHQGAHQRRRHTRNVPPPASKAAAAAASTYSSAGVRAGTGVARMGGWLGGELGTGLVSTGAGENAVWGVVIGVGTPADPALAPNALLPAGCEPPPPLPEFGTTPAEAGVSV